MKTGKSLIFVLMSCLMLLDHSLITGFKLLTEEDKKLEKQWKLLNKPVVTTIQTKYGEWYDCIDFYQQPAFDHPLLRNNKYKYQMSTSFDRLNDKSGNNLFDIWINGKGCPNNTVPIKRVTKEDLISANMASELAYTSSFKENPGVQVAVLKTTGNNKYFGGGMYTSVYRPPVQSTQYSSNRIILGNGPDSIAVGWVVNPSLYSDNEARLFVYTNTKDSHCYNTFCPGFIITRSDIPLNIMFKPVSVNGGKTYEVFFALGKDDITGDWAFIMGKERTIVGYWPKKIFTNLADSASYVEWGGEVYSPPGTVPPPMGCGHLPTRSLRDGCFARSLSIVDWNNKLHENPPSCVPYHTSQKYNVIDLGYTSRYDKRAIVFGGSS